MSKLQLQVGDVFYIESKNEVRIITRVGSNSVSYGLYALVNGKWKLFFYNSLDLNTFLYLFGKFKVSKLKAILLKSQIEDNT